MLGIRRLPFADLLAKTDAPLFDRADITVFCNHVGQDGWELVQVVPGPNSEQLIAYMKRAKS